MNAGLPVDRQTNVPRQMLGNSLRLTSKDFSTATLCLKEKAPETQGEHRVVFCPIQCDKHKCISFLVTIGKVS